MIAGLIVVGLAGVALLVFTPGNGGGGTPSRLGGPTAPFDSSNLGTASSGPTPDADASGAASADGISAKQRDYCAQVDALNQISPLIELYYNAKELQQLKTAVLQYHQQIAYLSRIAPKDVATQTNAMLAGSTPLNTAIQGAKTLTDVTTYLHQHIGEYLLQVQPWLTWTKLNCPTVSGSSPAP